MTQQFRTELFTDPTEYEERPLRDRKRDFPNLSDRKERRNFVKRVIAMANTTRLWCGAAYLFYGIDNDGQIYGLENSVIASYGNLDDVSPWEKAREKIRDTLSEFVTPPLLKWDLLHGKINETPVAYLLIAPVGTGPFKVKQALDTLLAGQCWIRFGESAQDIDDYVLSPEDDLYTYAYSSIPYILPRVWQRYFEGILNDRNSAENLTVAQDIRGYQDLYTTDGRLLQEVVTQFLNGSETLLVIEGAAGSGKSAFVRRWIVAQTEAQLQAMEQKIEREEFTPPVGWIPVYHRLRNEPVRTNYRLETRLLDVINKKSESSFWSGKRPSQPEELFCKPDLHWVICLDGLDEVRTQEQQHIFIETLHGFLEAYPRVKVILTTRPDTGIGTLKTCGNTVTIAPFNDGPVMLYLKNWVESKDYAEFVEFLHSDDELWELCRTPACLEVAVGKMIEIAESKLSEPVELMKASSIEPAPIFESSINDTVIIAVPKASDEDLTLLNPTTTDIPELATFRVGKVLDEMYRDLWDRERKRHSEFSSYEVLWWEQTGRLALKMDGIQFSILETEAQRALGATALRHVLGLGILRRDPRLVGFNTELTKAYFAAVWLRDCLETNDVSQARRLLAPATVAFQQRVRDLLEPLTVKDIQPLFQGGEL